MEISIPVLIFLTIWEIFELGNLLVETFWQKSTSPIYKLITIMRGPVLQREKILQIVYGIDTYGNLTHFLIIFIFAAIVGFSNVPYWATILQMVALGFALTVLLIDLLIWIPISVKLSLQPLALSAEYLASKMDILPSDNWKIEVQRLRHTISCLRLGSLVPTFAFRFVTIVLLVVLTFTFEYSLITHLDRNSFTDTFNNQVSSFDAFLYQSVMITTTFGPPFAPNNNWARLLVATHAVTTIYLFVVVLAFFGSISEDKVSIEKEKLLGRFDHLLGSHLDYPVRNNSNQFTSGGREL